MKNQMFCPVQEALFRLESSAKTHRDLINALYFLQRTVSSLLTQPTEWRYKTLQKDNELFAHQLLNWEEARQLLKLIGFSETDGAYVHDFCDEEMRFLEATLRILNSHIHNLRISFIEEKPYFEMWRDERRLRNPRTLSANDSQSEKVVETKGKNVRLQNMLARHLKEDHVGKGKMVWKKNETSSNASSFNSEGYFHQTSQRRDQRKRNSFFEERFDRHDFNNDVKGCAFFPFLKLG